MVGTESITLGADHCHRLLCVTHAWSTRKKQILLLSWLTTWPELAESRCIPCDLACDPEICAAVLHRRLANRATLRATVRLGPVAWQHALCFHVAASC
jgi:hypothetical protein